MSDRMYFIHLEYVTINATEIDWMREDPDEPGTTTVWLRGGTWVIVDMSREEFLDLVSQVGVPIASVTAPRKDTEGGTE